MRVNVFSFLGMESTVILRSDKKNMTGGMREWKKEKGSSRLMGSKLAHKGLGQNTEHTVVNSRATTKSYYGLISSSSR